MTPKHQALKRKVEESPRAREIRERNEKARISNMTPVWIDRHNRRHGKGSTYDHSLKSRQEAIKEYSKSS